MFLGKEKLPTRSSYQEDAVLLVVPQSSQKCRAQTRGQAWPFRSTGREQSLHLLLVGLGESCSLTHTGWFQFHSIRSNSTKPSPTHLGNSTFIYRKSSPSIMTVLLKQQVIPDPSTGHASNLTQPNPSPAPTPITTVRYQRAGRQLVNPLGEKYSHPYGTTVLHTSITKRNPFSR